MRLKNRVMSVLLSTGLVLLASKRSDSPVRKA
jgi:hypothetical protein